MMLVYHTVFAFNQSRKFYRVPRENDCSNARTTGEKMSSSEEQGHRKDFEIIVNGRKKVVTKNELSFDEIVALAFNPVPSGPNIMFTITYRHGPAANPQGNLLEGGTVKLIDGMIFNVTATDKS